MAKGKEGFYCKCVKGLLARLIAFIGITLTLWLWVIFAIIIKIDDPKGPVIFRQKRIGKGGKVYNMLKFRSMKVDSEHTGSGVYSDKSDPRVTKIGRFLRATSLDELPQLWNILKGDMVFIGYRSPLTYHPWTWEEYTPEQKVMFDIKPGITGWAQVNGRRTVEWHKRIEMNIWYAQNVSFGLDVKIVFRTIFKVISEADNENVGETVDRNAT